MKQEDQWMILKETKIWVKIKGKRINLNIKKSIGENVQVFYGYPAGNKK